MASKKIATILSLKDKMSSPLTKVSNNVTKVTREMKKSQNQINKWGKSAVKSIDNVIKKAAKIGATAIGAGAVAGTAVLIKQTDIYTGIQARLGLVADKQNSIKSLNDKIFKSANNARIPYEDIANSVGKLGINAKDAFSGTDEILKFSELLAKSFKISGASTEEQESAMHQLTQAMASGRLQGDEFVSIMENAPGIAQAIAKEMGVGVGELKAMSSEGKITSDVIKKAMFGSADDINKKFASIPMTFGEMSIKLKNLINKNFQPVMKDLSKWLNSSSVQASIENMVKSFVDKIPKAINFVKELITKVQELFNFVKKYEQIITTLVVFIGAIYTVIKVIGVMKVALVALNTIWLLFNGTLAITPLGWIILAIGAVVAAGYLLYRNWDKIKEKAKELGVNFGELKDKYITPVIEVLKNFGKILWDMVLQIVESFKPLIETFKTIFNQIKDVVIQLIPILMPIVAFIAGVFIVKIVYGFMLLANQVKAVISTIAGVLNGLLRILSGVIDFVVGVFTGNWSMAWEGVKSIFGGFVDILQSLWEGLVGLLTAPVDAVVGILDAVFKEKVAGVKKLWEGLKTFLKNPIEGVVNLFRRDKGGDVDGSHRTGLPRVPWDGYIAELHKGETVLTKDEADDYYGGKPPDKPGSKPPTNNSGGGMAVSVVIQGNVIGNKQFADEVGSTVYKKVKLALDNI
ncbi:tape measure protein [Tissierella creatinophila]|uniref:Tape measure protein N-terminal domain-containing protein n=1 Tax=Tissierella creatinophila DSM 6911 TaxID=1123403 RepID=A0A1U7M4X1_TISCR|nr:tape measure protein [Tissierella creatinophila]OLS02238.1 hypothetical protein TICRE_17900 [Tissierella creatinophila DSM 6911]